jgi:carboxymethylenebutenolidase
MLYMRRSALTTMSRAAGFSGMPGTLCYHGLVAVEENSAAAYAKKIFMEKIEIRTKDGTCPSYIYRPAGSGPWPAVLVFMDGLGIRPAMLELGERLAAHGYYVLLPDLYYRSGPYEPMDPHVVFTDSEKRKILMEKFLGLATPANIMSDTRAFLDYLAAQHDVKPGGIGTTGYCMGGLMSLTAAGTYPDDIVATASYHGGRLATDAPDSPHLLAPKMKSRVYVAGAIEDQGFPDDMKERLETARCGAPSTSSVWIDSCSPSTIHSAPRVRVATTLWNSKSSSVRKTWPSLPTGMPKRS